MRLMEEAASKHSRVLADPPAKAFLARFADSGIELELGVWIDDPESGMLNLRSELNLAVWHAFQEAGIEIPYPQGHEPFTPYMAFIDAVMNLGWTGTHALIERMAKAG